MIPAFAGCYAFTIDPGPLVVGTPLYIGMTTTSLAERLRTYLVDFTATKKSEREEKRRKPHKGKGFVLHARAEHGDHGVFLRWVEYGGSRGDISILEASLIHFLEPAANDRDEDKYHPILSDRETLHPLLLR